MINIKVSAEFVDTRLDKFLRLNNYMIPQSLLQKYLRKSLIQINGKKTTSNYRVKENDIITSKIKNIFENNTPNSQEHNKQYNNQLIKKIKDSIIFQNKDFIVINKPYGLASQGGNKISHSLDEYLKFMYQDYTPKLVHRLDQHTTGLMVVALNHKSAVILASKIRNNEIKKEYLAIIVGKMPQKNGSITNKLVNDYKVKLSEEGKLSRTKYQVIDQNDKVSLVKLKLITGRKHQLRATCNDCGAPILGDGKYGGKNAFLNSQKYRLHLHSYMIEIRNLFDQNYVFKAPLSDFFQKSIESFNLKLK